MTNKDIIYLSGSFFNSSYVFTNKHNDLLYLKKDGNYYRQLNKDNPLVYKKDDTVSELKDLVNEYWYDPISPYSETGSKKVHQYIRKTLSEFKKPKNWCIYSFTYKQFVSDLSELPDYYSNLSTLVTINEGCVRFKFNDNLYVPKELMDYGIENVRIVVCKDQLYLNFKRELSDGNYSIIYDKNFHPVQAKDLNLPEFYLD
nr:hypothetical protein [uncultured Ligilactobacillus sp.]